MISRLLRLVAVAAIISVGSMAFAVSGFGQKSEPVGNKSKMAFGFAYDLSVMPIAASSLTLLYDLSPKSAIQGYFLSAGSDPNLYGIGGIYKVTLKGNKLTGLHVGGGLSLGTYAQDQSFMHILGVVGFHFTVHKKIMLHADGGLTYTNDKVGNDTKSQIYITGHSTLFGLSVMYMF